MTTRIVGAVFVVAITLASGATAFAHGDDGVFSGTDAVPADGDPLTVWCAPASYTRTTATRRPARL